VVEKRRYNTALRAEQARLTRAKILDTAAALFVEQGYPGTTLAQVAAATGVSVQTVYNLVGGKPDVLKAAYDVVLAGDDEPVPIQQRPTARASMAATDPRTSLMLYAKLGRELSERILPLVVVLMGQAATGDPDLVAFAEKIEGERAIGTRNVVAHIDHHFGLRPGLDVDTAADILWALTAPDVTDRLVQRRGWGWDRFEQWLGETMADALLGPAPAPTATPATLG